MSQIYGIGTVTTVLSFSQPDFTEDVNDLVERGWKIVAHSFSANEDGECWTAVLVVEEPK